MKLYASLNDGIKEATVSFAPEKLATLQEKHGANLRLLTAYVPKLAAVGTATLTSFADRPVAKSAKKRALVPLTPPVAVAPSPPVPPVRERKAKTNLPKVAKVKAGSKKKLAMVTPRKKRGEMKGRAVVSITIGRYYISASQAARAIGCHSSNLYEQLRGTGRRNCIRRTVKGHVFRYATPDEVAAGRVLDAQPVA